MIASKKPERKTHDIGEKNGQTLYSFVARLYTEKKKNTKEGYTVHTGCESE